MADLKKKDDQFYINPLIAFSKKRDLTSAQPDFMKKANIQSKAHSIDNLCRPGAVKELKKAMELGK